MRTVRDERRERTALAVGFLALAGAIILARASPATGYEVSPYTYTPTAFWAAIAIALAVAVLVSVGTASRPLYGFALVLGGAAIAAVSAIPLLRGYHYYGLWDGLTHLGWTKDLLNGVLSPFEMIYPGIHSAGAVTAIVTGVDTERALLLVVFACVVLFLLAVPIAVRTITPSRHALTVGAFSGAMLLPITHVSTHMNVHTTSQATLFSILLIVLIVKYARATGRNAPALAGLVAVGSAALVLYHPQVAVHLLGALIAASLVQFVFRLVGSPGSLRPVYLPAGILGVAYVLWSGNHGFFSEATADAVGAAVEFVTGDEADPAGAAVATQADSVLSVGGSVAELFAKLFLVSAVFCAAMVALMALVLWRRERSPVGVLSTHYLGISAIALGPAFLLYYVGAWGEMYFRVVGLGMVLATVVGAVAIGRGLTGLGDRLAVDCRPLLAIGLAAALALSLAVVFPSPYIYQPSPHATEMQMTGHENAFENQYQEVPFAGVRQGPYRYTDAIHGGGRTTEFDESVPGPVLERGLTTYFDDDRYVIVTEVDREHEVTAFRELRYTEENLDGVDAQPDVHRVQTNDEFELYYVRAE